MLKQRFITQCLIKCYLLSIRSTFFFITSNTLRLKYYIRVEYKSGYNKYFQAVSLTFQF